MLTSETSAHAATAMENTAEVLNVTTKTIAEITTDVSK